MASTQMIRQSNAGVFEREYRVKGDGNCFFRAVLEALRLKNMTPFGTSEEAHEILRELVVDVGTSGRYKFDIMECEKPEIQWAREMRQVGSWAESMAVRACADALECPITVLSEDGIEMMSFGEGYFHSHPVTGIDNQVWLKLSSGHYDVFVW